MHRGKHRIHEPSRQSGLESFSSIQFTSRPKSLPKRSISASLSSRSYSNNLDSIRESSNISGKKTAVYYSARRAIAISKPTSTTILRLTCANA
ncbi:hypothetical protein TCAP_07519 [Tolypocladium capitatum]|uniref:Uncharacterized protein n=1 Tax=Tolypocladium capitatum TaxID=45235 RepID=A0A2K3PT15_9HYPO|nr:hypothetical protein TCAP_07519 [Tolypocladium capitatum]